MKVVRICKICLVCQTDIKMTAMLMMMNSDNNINNAYQDCAIHSCVTHICLIWSGGGECIVICIHI